jgi:hypothetical protein
VVKVFVDRKAAYPVLAGYLRDVGVRLQGLKYDLPTLIGVLTAMIVSKTAYLALYSLARAPRRRRPACNVLDGA